MSARLDVGRADVGTRPPNAESRTAGCDGGIFTASGPCRTITSEWQLLLSARTPGPLPPEGVHPRRCAHARPVRGIHYRAAPRHRDEGRLWAKPPRDCHRRPANRHVLFAERGVVAECAQSVATNDETDPPMHSMRSSWSSATWLPRRRARLVILFGYPKRPG